MFRRNPRRPVAVVSERTCRAAEETAARLLASPDPADWAWGHGQIALITSWAGQQALHGRRARREQQAERLRHWHQQEAGLSARLGIAPPPEPIALRLLRLRALSGPDQPPHERKEDTP